MRTYGENCSRSETGAVKAVRTVHAVESGSISSIKEAAKTVIPQR